MAKSVVDKYPFLKDCIGEGQVRYCTIESVRMWCFIAYIFLMLGLNYFHMHILTVPANWAIGTNYTVCCTSHAHAYLYAPAAFLEVVLVQSLSKCEPTSH